jgi:hypothetical protein
MATTTIINWTHLTGSIFEPKSGLNSHDELNTSNNARGSMSDAARKHLIKSANKFLQPYSGQMLETGEIILDLDTNALTWNQRAENNFRKMLAGIDYHGILAAA